MVLQTSSPYDEGIVWKFDARGLNPIRPEVNRCRRFGNRCRANFSIPQIDPIFDYVPVCGSKLDICREMERGFFRTPPGARIARVS